MRILKRFISVICIAFFALFSAWSTPAQSSPKIVALKVKAEKVVSQTPAKVTTPNFERTDSLVFYETDLPAARTAVLVVNESSSVIYSGDSNYTYRPTERRRNIRFIYV